MWTLKLLMGALFMEYLMHLLKMQHILKNKLKYTRLLSPLEWILISLNRTKWNSTFSAVTFMIFKIFLPWANSQRHLTCYFSRHTSRLVISMVTHHKTTVKYSISAILTYFTWDLVSLDQSKSNGHNNTLTCLLTIFSKISSHIFQLSAWKHLGKY